MVGESQRGEPLGLFGFGDALTFKPIGESFGRGNSMEFDVEGRRLLTSRDYSGLTQMWDGLTGQRLSEPLLSGKEVKFGHFSPDGQVVITGEHRSTYAWEAASAPLPMPPWFLELAEVSAGQRFNQHGQLEPFRAGDWLALRERLRAVLPAIASADTPYVRILRKYVQQ